MPWFRFIGPIINIRWQFTGVWMVAQPFRHLQWSVTGTCPVWARGNLSHYPLTSPPATVYSSIVYFSVFPFLIACFCRIWFSFVLRCDSCLPCCNLNELLDPFPVWGGLLNKKAARIDINVSLAILHPWLFISDVAIFVLKRDVKFQLT